MVLTKRKLRPDGFQTVGPPGLLATPTYSSFSNSCILIYVEMSECDVHGPGQSGIPKLGLFSEVKALRHSPPEPSFST